MKIKHFAILKPGDFVYRIKNQIDNKPDDKQFGGLLMHKPEEYYDFRIEKLEVEKVEPWMVEHHYNYMKIDAFERPYGVGTTVSKTKDEHHVRVQFKSSEIPCGFDYMMFANGDTSYVSYDKKLFYFTDKKQAISTYKMLINDRINELKETINQLNDLKKISNNI